MTPEEAVALWRERARRASDLTEVIGSVAADFSALVLAGMAAGARPDGRAWRRLSAATVEIRARRGQAGPPLNATGALASSVYVRQTGRTSVGFGAAAGYARIHQTGGAVRVFGGKASRVPARPFLPFTRSRSGGWRPARYGQPGTVWRGARVAVRDYLVRVR